MLAVRLTIPSLSSAHPVALAWLGLLGCAGLAFQVPPAAWRSGLLVLVLGLLWRWAYRRLRPTAP